MSVDEDQWADQRAQEEPRALRFPTLTEFVEHLADIYRREVVNTNARVWCPDWWKHGEAVIRLEAMWRALEALRLDPSLGILSWLERADYQMSVLMDPDGPFKGCDANRGHSPFPLTPLPTSPVPDGWWTPDDSGL